MDIAATQYLLGIRPQLAGLLIDSCIPADWKAFRVQRTYRACHLDITIQNPTGVSKGVKSIHVDGRPLDITRSPLILAATLAGKSAANVVATMG